VYNYIVQLTTVMLQFVCILVYDPQRRRQFRRDAGHQGDHIPRRACRMETAGHIQIVVRDRRGIFPVRRADVRVEIR